MAATEGVLRIVNRHFPNVTKVRDATSPLMIEVTPTDMKTSKRKDMEQCAMAVACKRAYKADGAIIARSVAYLIKGDLAVRFRVPISVMREITSFDRGGTFDPGEYLLAVPQTSKTLAGKIAGNPLKKGGNKGNHGIRKMHLTQGIRAVLGSVEDKG